ncbi:MFS transporter [Paenibacillus filicis]|uniref:MFS transporter n=1 Tax=Paenibacillus gyeongsangnamensis TaxID=3388067 RepID=A0ABT4QJN6_9BACL|nr:MFS transporter [Paenibacillus filicis]MCZ8516997.1 MFS transporter [Paenibacillus filicis]
MSIYVLALGVFLTATSELVISGILHVIAKDLNISIALAGQLITAYSLAFSMGTPIMVSLTSHIGRRKVLVGSLAVFILGCLASFGSSNISILMVSRMILGKRRRLSCRSVRYGCTSHCLVSRQALIRHDRSRI